MTAIPHLPPFIPGHRWFMPLGTGHVYCRYSFRDGLRCLDLADVQVHDGERGHGLFTGLLDALEPLCGADHGIQALYIENVLNARLAAFLRRRGYRARLSAADPHVQSPCFLYQPD